MKKFYAILGMALLFSTVAMAQTKNEVKKVPTKAEISQKWQERAKQRPSKEEMAAKRQEMMKQKMAEKMAKMDKAQLAKQKERLEAMIAKEKDAKKAEFLKLRLEVIDSLLK